MIMSSLCYIIILISLGTIRIMMVEICFLICHITSCEHVFKGLCEFMDETPSQ